jgi:hypothetical protein
MHRIRRAILGALAAVAILGSALAVTTAPAGAGTGVLSWKANYHGITWTGWWDNWAGNARCAHSISVHQGWDGRAYAESRNFGYGIGACTDVWGNGSGADVYDQGATNHYRLRLDYTVFGLTYSTYSAWIGPQYDPYNGIDQYILLASPGQGYPVRVCVEANNLHNEPSQGYPWEQAVAPWEQWGSHCVAA